MTPQLAKWSGAFGDDYIARNDALDHRALTRMWAGMLRNVRPRSILEVGANVGHNLRALRTITDAKLAAAEPNELACERLRREGVLVANACAESLPFNDGAFDMVFTSGVLIHVHPDDLPPAMDEIARVADRYVLCAEYFSAEPREVPYRGQPGMLWTRDFGRAYLDHVPELRCVDYGFFWRGAGAVDSLTWWLFEKGRR